MRDDNQCDVWHSGHQCLLPYGHPGFHKIPDDRADRDLLAARVQALEVEARGLRNVIDGANGHLDICGADNAPTLTLAGRVDSLANQRDEARAEIVRLKAKLHDRCTCEHGDASMPLVKHDKDCPIRVNIRTRIAPEVALDRLAAALHTGDEADELREQLDKARTAARALSDRICDLGAFLDDTDPRIMATAGPLGAAQADLYIALGLDTDVAHAKMVADIDSRCAVCGWPLAESADKGCTRGNCSMRPRPEKLYAPERAARESLTAYDASKESE